ncbi:MAG: efflux RND transporter permease subunit [Marinifilaceae bacterium]|jgi:multidrug efflux pump subunit AcrB|nr:efflux RND transporter permease subunit [Marinifilaceae bacterium]
MKSIIQGFINHSFYGRLVIFLLFFFGIFCYLSMKKSSFPERESKTITVSVNYPGANPKQMEESVTTLIENALRGIPGIKETNSASSENSSRVTVTVEMDFKSESVLTEVKNAVDGISNLPGAADRPIVSWQKKKSPAAFLSLSGDCSLMELKETADIIEDEMLASGRLSQISISGVPSQEISVEINQENLLRYKLSFSDIQNAISSNNLDVTGGVIRNPREEINVLSRNRSVSPEDIQEIVISTSETGSVVRIKDVATVRYQFQESPNASYLDGNTAISISIMKLNSEDLIEISDYVNEYIEEFNAANPNKKLLVLFDFSSILKSRLDILSKNGIVGIILVIIFLTLFLNARLALWVAWGIPASFLGMFVFAYFAGITVNMISLFGMIMVIGILVDDGVVIGENIYSHFEAGKSPKQAAIDGVQEVLPSIITSVSTTIVAFTPLIFLQGKMSMMSEMAFVVIACLSMSLFEGIFILPSHLSHGSVLSREDETKSDFFTRFRKRLDTGLFKFRDNYYVKAVRFIIKYKWASVAFLISCVIVSMSLVIGGKIGVTFFPNVEDDYFTIDLALKPGTSDKITKQYLLYIEDACMKVSQEMTKEYKEDSQIIKFTELKTGSSFSGAENGTHAGSVAVMLKDIEKVEWSVSEVKRRIAQRIGKIEVARKFTVGASSHWGAPVSLSLLSRNEEQLYAATEWFKSKLTEINALYNVMDNNRLGNQEIRIKLKPKAFVLGLDQSSLMNQVRQAFFGGQAQRMVKGKNELRVYVRFPRENRQSIGQLEKLKIKTPKGIYPLYTLAELDYGRSPVTITRLNGRREITVEAYQKDPTQPLSPVTDMVDNELIPQLKEKFPKVDCATRGQMKDSKEESEQLSTGFAIAFLIMVLIIMLSFRSVSQALLILLVIPLGWISALWGHGIEGHPVSLLSVFGMVALSGTIINDAVVFLSRFNQNTERGMELIEAVIEAAKSRFRPILLTSVTTVVGLYPLILETSMQAKFLVPMAVSLAYGIFIGTIFILLFFPIYIICAKSITQRFRSVFSKK